MKRIYLYFGVLAVICVLIIGIWIYVKYIRTASTALLTYPAKRGSISEIVKSRGTVAAEDNLQLGFPTSGLVAHTYVKEGAAVNAGTLLMTLNATSAQANLAQLEANLAKLTAGATATDIAVSQAQADAARVAMINGLQDAYTACDDAVRNHVDRFISSGRSTQPLVDPALAADPALKTEIEQLRVTIETLLTAWNASVSTLAAASDVQPFITEADTNLAQVKFFLDRVAFMINGVYANAQLPQTTLDAYKLDASTARSNVVAAITEVSTAEGNLRTAQNELALKQAPARPEDITAAQAQIAAAQQAVANAVLRAPVAGTVVKFNVKPGEQYALGTNAVSFYSPDLKITSDLSELNIGRIPANGSPSVTIALDAFPGKTYTGHVVSVDPQEIIESGDTYYRVNVAFDQLPPEVKSGMSADLDIIIQTKNDVLSIPAFLVTTNDDGTKHVNVVRNGKPVDQIVTLGISDGENVEIVSGLNEGDVVAAN